MLAVEFFRREVDAIIDKAKVAHKLSVDIQKPRGSFSLDFIDGLTHHYRDIQNFIVKLEPRDRESKHSLLLNCHFDSVPQSPGKYCYELHEADFFCILQALPPLMAGASDDAVSCAIMLEILAVLTQSEQPLKHNVIFLFNGAEENMLPVSVSLSCCGWCPVSFSQDTYSLLLLKQLSSTFNFQASHGFITQHEWASSVRSFINLEACGAGGREFVFQTGPHAPWMINAYGRVAPFPFASVIGQEIFQSGVITADTDFRIFRDYGNVPGLDIAYMKNGYVYHTGYDQEDAIPPGSIQRAGDNFLAVVQHIANSEELAHPEAQDNSNAVFFDVLGVFLINYPEGRGVFLNLISVGLSLYTAYARLRRSHEYGETIISIYCSFALSISLFGLIGRRG